jgi:hypothetical protein
MKYGISMFGHLRAIFPWSEGFLHLSYFDGVVGFLFQFVKLTNNKT